HLEHIKARLVRAPGSLAPGLDELADLIARQGARRGVAFGEESALGATSSQASQSSISIEGLSGAPPSQGRKRRAFRPEWRSGVAFGPEWQSWRRGTRAGRRRNSPHRLSPGMKSSFQIPRSPTVPQPRRSTLVDSMITRPAPPAANPPAFMRCQSVAYPLTAE